MNKLSHWWEVWRTASKDGTPWTHSNSQYIDRFMDVDNAIKRMNAVVELPRPYRVTVVSFSNGTHYMNLRKSKNNVVICG